MNLCLQHFRAFVTPNPTLSDSSCKAVPKATNHLVRFATSKEARLLSISSFYCYPYYWDSVPGKQLKEGRKRGFVLTQNSQVQPIIMTKSGWQKVGATGHTACAVRQHREMLNKREASQLSLPTQSQFCAQQMITAHQRY